jgi:hypothetical protein
MWGTSGFKKAQAVIRKRKQREKELEEADGEEPEPKKRKVPAKFKKTLRSSMFTCPRVKETEGVNARTQWLDVFKSLPNNTLSNALVVLEPHMPDEGIPDEWAEDTEEAKPPNHIHAFVWYDEPTDLLTVVKHLHAQMPGYMEDTRDSGIGLKGTFEFTEGKYGPRITAAFAMSTKLTPTRRCSSTSGSKATRLTHLVAVILNKPTQPRRFMALNRGPCSLLKAARPARSSRSSDTSICASALSALCAN